jgi:hypothetical protein
MQCLSRLLTRLILAALAVGIPIVHPVQGSPANLALDQHECGLDSVVDESATHRLTRAVSLVRLIES